MERSCSLSSRVSSQWPWDRLQCETPAPRCGARSCRVLRPTQPGTYAEAKARSAGLWDPAAPAPAASGQQPPGSDTDCGPRKLVRLPEPLQGRRVRGFLREGNPRVDRAPRRWQSARRDQASSPELPWRAASVPHLGRHPTGVVPWPGTPRGPLTRHPFLQEEQLGLKPAKAPCQASLPSAQHHFPHTKAPGTALGDELCLTASGDGMWGPRAGWRQGDPGGRGPGGSRGTPSPAGAPSPCGPGSAHSRQTHRVGGFFGGIKSSLPGGKSRTLPPHPGSQPASHQVPRALPQQQPADRSPTSGLAKHKPSASGLPHTARLHWRHLRRAAAGHGHGGGAQEAKQPQASPLTAS